MEATTPETTSKLLAGAVRADDSSQLRHFFHITRALATTEFKLRYFGSVLGYLWSLLRPLMLFAVLYLVFTHIVKFGERVPHYAVILLAAIVIFTFFSEATGNGLPSLVAQESLIRKVAFPRAAIPIAVSATSAANLAIGVVIVFGFAIIDGVDPGYTWLLFLGVTAAVVVLATALAVLLSALYVRFRDMQPIWEVVLQLMFWGTPIFYTIQDVPESVRPIMLANPVAAAIQQAKHWISPASTPSVHEALDSWALVAIPIALALLAIVLAFVVFRWAQNTLAEDM